MNKYGLNARQLVFLKRVWLKMYTEMYGYLRADASNLNCEHAINKDEIAKMHENGILDHPWYHSDLLPDKVEVTRKVSKDLAKIYGFSLSEIEKADRQRSEYRDMALDFFDAYPDIGTHQNGEFATKTTGDGFTYQGVTYYTDEDLFQCYLDSIKYNKELHNEILELLRDPEVRERYMFPKIYRFVINKSYTALKALKEKIDSTTDWLSLGGE